MADKVVELLEEYAARQDELDAQKVAAGIRELVKNTKVREMPTEAELDKKYRAFNEANKQLCKCGAEMMKQDRHTYFCRCCCRLLHVFYDGKYWYKLEHVEAAR